MTLRILGLLIGAALAACTSSSSSIGSPERTAHFLACLPVALGQVATTSKQIDAAGTVTPGQVLDAMDTKVASGDVAAVAMACGPYLADLAADGNAQAKALRERLAAKVPAKP